MYWLFACIPLIFTRAVTPTATATAATMRTAAAILTATGRLANQPARRGVGGEGVSLVTSIRPKVVIPGATPVVVTRGLLSFHGHARGLSAYGFTNRDVYGRSASRGRTFVATACASPFSIKIYGGVKCLVRQISAPRVDMPRPVTAFRNGRSPRL